MDPVTQGALGAAATLAVLQKRSPLSAPALCAMGCAGGMAPDLDILIRSSTDPLLAIEYHRHFTHALSFIPVGGLIVALPWYFQKKWRSLFLWIWAATTIGYATHGLLDACTSYGTLLFWPFSDHRVSWRFVSVIDPLVTIPLLFGVVFAVRQNRQALARLATAWVIAIIGLGAMQQQHAYIAQTAIISKRGHAATRRAIFPMFANNIAWRSIYRQDDTYYVDKIRVPWNAPACITPGTHVPVLKERELTQLSGNGEKTKRAIQLISWFSQEWIARDPENPETIGDLRYSFSPLEAAPIWGVQVNPETQTVQWVNNRSKRSVAFNDFVELVQHDGHNATCL